MSCPGVPKEGNKLQGLMEALEAGGLITFQKDADGYPLNPQIEDPNNFLPSQAGGESTLISGYRLKIGRMMQLGLERMQGARFDLTLKRILICEWPGCPGHFFFGRLSFDA